MQLNNINCEPTDSESVTENTVSINMIRVENDYEPNIYEQPICSHIYLSKPRTIFLNYYTSPINSNKTKEKIVEAITEEKPTECSSTNNIYQNMPKETQLPKEKFWTIPLLLESPKSKQFQTTDLEIDFVIDSGAESNIINIPTWNEIKVLHPKLKPLKTTSRLATAQGSTLTDYGQIQFFLVPTRTMEQNKIMSKPFKQTFHVTDIKHNIIGIPLITKKIPSIKILKRRIHIKLNTQE